MAKALPIPNLTRKATAADELRARLPAAVPEKSKSAGAKGRGEGRAVQIVMPPDTLKALKQRATDDDTTVRTVVLRALAKAGFPVPADEMKDRRKG